MARAVLIVDDEESILQSLQGILSDEGLEVFTAASGLSALEKIDEMLPDIVLLDIWMPEMDGFPPEPSRGNDVRSWDHRNGSKSHETWCL
jgi:CheY-like chemotaxis protein